MTQPEPLFRAENVRIDAGGGSPAVEGLTFATSGSNVAFVGAPRALFEATCGLRDVTAGALRIGGLAPVEALRRAAIASAPADVALPPRWSAMDLAVESARLAGHARRDRKRLASAAIHAMQIDAHAGARLGGVEPSVKRAALLAAALATDAPTLVVEDFTPGLPDAAARALARVFVSAVKGRRWALFAGRLALASPLGLEAEEAALFSGGRFAFAGMPAEVATRERTFAVRTSGEKSTELADKLRERGAEVDADESGRALTVTMPEGFTTLDLVALARASGVVVVELQPLSGAVA